LVFDDDLTLNWATVYKALGVGEPIIYTWRQTTSKRKLSSSGDGIVIGSSHASKKGPTATFSPNKKGQI